MDPTMKLSVGSTVPDFTLLNSQEEIVALSQEVKKGRVVLVFYRGFWWPYCRRQLAELQQKSAEWKQHKVTIFGISVDSPTENSQLRKKMQISFEILSDAERKVIQQWNIVNRIERNGIPFPNVYVLNARREIIFHSRDRLASRVDSTPLLQFLEQHEKNPELRTKNRQFKTRWPTLSDIVLYLPRRILGWSKY